jgi:hypothetical protein
MTDINPVLDRLAHRSAEKRMHMFQHHTRAAHHHEKAAEQHRLAAEAHRSGDTTVAASYATQAWGHGAHAQDHANESLKGYAPTEEPPLGYPTGGTAGVGETVNPDAAYTPNIGGAPGERS